jgi:Tfp pilus assembly protein PilV
LIEVMISALLVTLIAGAVAGALIGNTDFSADQHRRSEAQDLAQQDQERLKGLSSEQLDNLNQSYTTTLDNSKFTVNSQAWYLNGTSGQACTSQAGANATYFKTISTVTWTNASTGATQTLATDESVISPPAGGGILAEVHDQTTQPLPGVAVAASGTGLPSYAGTTDSNGCTIFSAIESGAYTVTETDIGYVDPNGNASPLSTTANVSSTGLAWPQNGNPVEMGQGGGITGNFSTTYSSNAYTADADGLSWFSSGGAGIPMSTFRCATSTGAVCSGTPSLASSISTTTKSGTTSIDGLFPFVSSLNPVSYTNNYQVWGGTCLQEQPPAGIDMFTVTPGSTNAQSIQEPALDLAVTWKASAGSTVTHIAPTDVKMSFQSTAGSGTTCNDTWALTGSQTSASPGPSGSNSYVYGMPFASSQTSGSTASGSGETGSVTVCVDYLYSGTYYEATPGSGITDSFSTPTSYTVPLTYQSTRGKC